MMIKSQQGFFGNSHMWLAGLGLLILFLPFPVFASLGGDTNSVQNDQAQMKATQRTVQSKDGYTVQQITTPLGVVREYVSSSGQVFGVAWRGPALPNFQQLFGSYYQQFAQAAQTQRTAQPRRSRKAPLSIEQPGLVVHSGGHERAYAGRAYIPGMLPPNVNPSDIR